MGGVLDGKVVLVTGAAGGIGRACAELAVREGAKVVLNDLGGGVAGGDAGAAGPAEAAAAEIREAGGQCVANADSVASMDGVRNMVRQALDVFGGLHIVMNPAGILRDKMLHKMAEEDWDAVIEVHLRGAYNITRATIEHFRENEGGIYVHFTSTSGLIGNLGQANYAAAKMGVVGLSRVIAMEGESRGIRSNVIAPFAWTRMLDGVRPRDQQHADRLARLKSTMRADQVATLAVALASPRAEKITGQIFAARGDEISLFSQPRPIKSLSRLGGWTPDSIIDHAFPAMHKDLYDLGATSAVYPYDPVG